MKHHKIQNLVENRLSFQKIKNLILANRIEILEPPCYDTEKRREKTAVKRIFPLLLAAAVLLCGCSAAGSSAIEDLNMDKIAAAAAPKLGSSNSVEGTGVYPQWDEGAEAMDSAGLESSLTLDGGDDTVLLTVNQQKKSVQTKKGTIAFSLEYDEASVSSQCYPDSARQISEQLNTYLQRRLDQAEQQEAEALEACQAAEGAGETFYGWTSFYDITAQRVDENYVSVVAYSSVYLGGAHPDNNQAAMNFDTATGSLLSLSSIFKSESKEFILSKLLYRLSEMKSSFLLFDGYENTVREKFEQMPADMTQNWYLTNQGVVFFYNPYEISPYASGVVSVELSYPELVGYLRDDFSWPPRDQSGESALQISSSSGDLRKSEYDQVIEVSAGKGTRAVITVTGEIRNLRVDLVQVAGDAAVSSDLLLAANRLTEQDAVFLSLPEASEGSQSSIGIQLTYDIGYHESVIQIYTIQDGSTQLVEQTQDN